MDIQKSELVKAIVSYAGPFDDPRIGWNGARPSSPELFRCERCGEEHLDCSQIKHKEDCSAKALLDILARIRGSV